MSRFMGKPTFCICENKDADQLRENRKADQRLRFRYTDSTFPLLSKSENSSLLISSLAVQPGLCWTLSETWTLVFSHSCSAMTWENQNSGFHPGLTQIGVHSKRKWSEVWNFGFGKNNKCTYQVAKTKALISFAVTVKLICVFVFPYAKRWFSHNVWQSGFRPGPTQTRLNSHWGCLEAWNFGFKK